MTLLATPTHQQVLFKSTPKGPFSLVVYPDSPILPLPTTATFVEQLYHHRPLVPLGFQGQRHCLNLLREKALLSSVMSVPWNFTLSTDNASGTHQDSVDPQEVEGQCL